MKTEKGKCNHDEFVQGQLGEECLKCGLLRTTIDNIKGYPQSEKCDCAEISCKDGCTRDHTCKTFRCEKCQSESVSEIVEWEKEECQVRWKYHGTFNVVCGALYPCSQHTSREDRKKWIDEIVASAVEAREREIKSDLLKVADEIEGEELRSEVERYFKTIE